MCLHCASSVLSLGVLGYKLQSQSPSTPYLLHAGPGILGVDALHLSPHRASTAFIVYSVIIPTHSAFRGRFNMAVKVLGALHKNYQVPNHTTHVHLHIVSILLDLAYDYVVDGSSYVSLVGD